MILTKVDRYITWSFLSRLFGCLLLLGFLYVTFDFLKRWDDIEEGQVAESLLALASYYGYLVPVFLADIMPAIVLVAAGMTLVNMVRRHEMLILKASGVSVYRILAPIFFWVLLLNLAVFGFREMIGPKFARRQQVLDHVLDSDVAKRLVLRDARFDRRMFVERFDFARQTMQNLCVMRFSSGPRPVLREVTLADSATWGTDGGLKLENAVVRDFDEAGVPLSPLRSFPTLNVQTDLTPFDFAQASDKGSEAGALVRTLPELGQLAREQPGIPHFRVLLHSRLASFFSPFILLLVGIPCLIGFEHSVNSRFLSVIIGIVVAAGFYVLTFIFTSMGETLTVPAVLAGWLPSIVAGSAGLWLFQAMLT